MNESDVEMTVPAETGETRAIHGSEAAPQIDPITSKAQLQDVITAIPSPTKFQDVKLRKLVQVTKSHVTYVNYFLSEFSNDEKSSRSDWEKKRFRLLQMSFIILNGLNELITKVKRTDFYTKFIHAKSSNAIKVNGISQRCIIRCIHQLLVELGPEDVMVDPMVIIDALKGIINSPVPIDVTDRTKDDESMENESELLFDMIEKRIEIWPVDLLTVTRIPSELNELGTCLNAMEPIRNLQKFLSSLESHFKTKMILFRQYMTIRVSSLIRAGYFNAAFILLYSLFIIDSREFNTQTDLKYRVAGKCSNNMLKRYCPSNQIFYLANASSNQAAFAEFIKSLNLEPIAFFSRTGIHNSFTTFSLAQYKLNLCLIEYMSTSSVPDCYNILLPQFINPVVSRIFSKLRKASVFEEQIIKAVFDSCRSNIKVLIVLINKIFHYVDTADNLNETLLKLYSVQTAIRMIAISVDENLPADWLLTLAKLCLKLFKNSPKIQLIVRILLIATIKESKIGQTGPRHFYSLIMTNEHWHMDHFRTKKETFINRKNLLFPSSKMYSQSVHYIGECSLYHDHAIDYLVNVLQSVPGFPEKLKPMIFDEKFNIFDIYEKLIDQMCSKMSDSGEHKIFLNDILTRLSPRNITMLANKGIGLNVQSKLIEIIERKLKENNNTVLGTGVVQLKRQQNNTIEWTSPEGLQRLSFNREQCTIMCTPNSNSNSANSTTGSPKINLGRSVAIIE